MNRATLQVLRCPEGCDSDLNLHTTQVDGAGEVLGGSIACSGCGGVYPIDRGIARMLQSSLRSNYQTEDNEIQCKHSEMKARDDQAEHYDRIWWLNLFSRIEIPVTLALLKVNPQDRVLEAGCGTGRMTADFANRCRHLVAADYSWQSLLRCRQKITAGGIRNVDLIQADICHLPLAKNAFDRVVSCQVLEHIPTPASRERAISELARVSSGGGRIVLSAYQYSIWMRLFNQREGQHDGGIYFYRFSRKEFQRLLSNKMHVHRITGALQYHFLAQCAADED
ncbi:MAG: methyltransferase domain-containing protein [Armatimonadetes bacterium]|nr:methyltransferase domain-containing protein [Armatimonadota bacterium]